MPDTDEFRDIVESISGIELDWFFDAYVHPATIPKLITARRDDVMVLRWDAGGLPLPMPLDEAWG